MPAPALLGVYYHLFTSLDEVGFLFLFLFLLVNICVGWLSLI